MNETVSKVISAVFGTLGLVFLGILILGGILTDPIGCIGGLVGGVLIAYGIIWVSKLE